MAMRASTSSGGQTVRGGQQQQSTTTPTMSRRAVAHDNKKDKEVIAEDAARALRSSSSASPSTTIATTTSWQDSPPSSSRGEDGVEENTEDRTDSTTDTSDESSKTERKTKTGGEQEDDAMVPLDVFEDSDREDYLQKQLDEALSHIPGKRWYRDSNVYRLLIMLSMTVSFFFAELVVGLMTDSLALVSDAFHMASDSLALFVGLLSLQLAKKRSGSNKYSYGWARAEIIGGLVNGVFLLSVVFFIFLEAIERFLDQPEVENPLLIVYVGAGGLVINIIGVFLFLKHAHLHGHSHGSSHSHSHSESNEEHSHSHSHSGHSHSHHSHSHNEHGEHDGEIAEAASASHSGAKHNLHGVFLHILGDALGSIAAIASGLLIHFLEWEHRFYIDPILSCLIAIIILFSSIPLVLSCMRILMQSVPAGLDLADLKTDLEKIPSVICVHDLHIWQLLDTKVIASVHVLCFKGSDFMQIARQIKQLFHNYNIHSVTIQPEFTSYSAVPSQQQDEHQHFGCIMQCVQDCDTIPAAQLEKASLLKGEKAL
ncbi:Zinc resistance conferring protein [Balamuthia mandrillaris]